MNGVNENQNDINTFQIESYAFLDTVDGHPIIKDIKNKIWKTLGSRKHKQEYYSIIYHNQQLHEKCTKLRKFLLHE